MDPALNVPYRARSKIKTRCPGRRRSRRRRRRFPPPDTALPLFLRHVFSRRVQFDGSGTYTSRTPSDLISSGIVAAAAVAAAPPPPAGIITFPRAASSGGVSHRSVFVRCDSGSLAVSSVVVYVSISPSWLLVAVCLDGGTGLGNSAG